MKDSKSKNKEELLKELKEKETALRTFHFSISGSKTRNVREGRNIRRTVARIRTLLKSIN